MPKHKKMSKDMNVHIPHKSGGKGAAHGAHGSKRKVPGKVSSYTQGKSGK